MGGTGPHPTLRLTLTTATQITDKQKEMVTMNAMLLELNKCAAEVKDCVKARVKDVVRLKAAKEDKLERTQCLEEERHWLKLHDWCVPSPTLLLLGGDLTVCIYLFQRYHAAVSLYKLLMSLESLKPHLRMSSS